MGVGVESREVMAFGNADGSIYGKLSISAFPRALEATPSLVHNAL